LQFEDRTTGKCYRMQGDLVFDGHRRRAIEVTLLEQSDVCGADRLRRQDQPITQ